MKWVWQAQIMSHPLLIWQKCMTFIDAQMMLLCLFLKVSRSIENLTYFIKFHYCAHHKANFSTKTDISWARVKIANLSGPVSMCLICSTETINFHSRVLEPINISIETHILSLKTLKKHERGTTRSEAYFSGLKIWIK